MDAIADYLGLDRAEVRSRNFILPEEMLTTACSSRTGGR